jgi:hypothetical protein
LPDGSLTPRECSRAVDTGSVNITDGQMLLVAPLKIQKVPQQHQYPQTVQGGLHTERLPGSGLFGEALFLEESLGKPFHTRLRKFEFCDFPDFPIVVFLAKTTIRKAFRSEAFSSTSREFRTDTQSEACKLMIMTYAVPTGGYLQARYTGYHDAIYAVRVGQCGEWLRSNHRLFEEKRLPAKSGGFRS